MNPYIEIHTFWLNYTCKSIDILQSFTTNRGLYDLLNMGLTKWVGTHITVKNNNVYDKTMRYTNIGLSLQ